MADFKDVFDISLEDACELEGIYGEAVARGRISAPTKLLQVEEVVLRAFRVVPCQWDGRMDRGLVVYTVLAELKTRGVTPG